jgi:GWxTD domain-containing protein
MNKYVRIIVFLLTLNMLVFGQSTFIPLSVDYASFRGTENQIYFEIYFSFNQNYLQYTLHDSGFSAEYFASAEIGREDSIYFQNFERKVSLIDSMNEISNYRKFLSIFTFTLDSGNYFATIKMKDLHSGGAGEYFLDFEVLPIPSENLSLSSIQLCSYIKPDTSKGEFQKNSFLTIPNPDNSYSINQPVIYYYTELYNLDYNEEKPGHYRLLSYITDLDGNIIKEYPEKVITKPGPSAVLVGGHNLITLPSSTYIFKISVEDLESKETIESFKRFTFLKPTDKKIAIADTIYQNNTEKINLEEYIELSDQELDQEFNKIRYLTSNRDSKIFQNLDSQSKKIFLAQFWKRLDNNPNTEVNEFKVYYNSMIEYANANFGTMNRQGLETDRGRILLTYGTPNEIERNYMVINQKPHEIWHYDELEGGSLFIFADITGFGEFDLIHSTYSRELYQPDWERLINKTQSSFDTETP